jgi:DDE family transposase
LTLLPEGVRVSVHGDSEFRSQGLFRWIRAQGHDALLRVRGDTLVFDSLEPRQPGSTLQERLGQRQDVLDLSGVYLTEQRHGPLNILAWWDKDDRGEPLVRGITTNLPARASTYRLGKRRMWIETVFRAWQSGGFHLDKSGLTDRQRFARLLIPLLIAYLWFISVGRWVVKRGYRLLIDNGESHHWQFSLFKLGIGWKDHLLSQGCPFPSLLCLYI